MAQSQRTQFLPEHVTSAKGFSPLVYGPSSHRRGKREGSGCSSKHRGYRAAVNAVVPLQLEASQEVNCVPIRARQVPPKRRLEPAELLTSLPDGHLLHIMAVLMKIFLISLVLSIVATAELKKCGDPCVSHQCGPGQRCVPRQVQCVRAPCCSLPHCTDADRSEG
ncbi:uncharacterized protein LOC126273222 [Schistocerca gregaria]|uniref:uncharacterized protein LOC126273222 n=1 Tax=Schistocerca gregaria TaxID=7010 RepID=UPI00211DBE35|nr:uncharacterized protein LOC126273222 [Schistocerca gregaria]